MRRSRRKSAQKRHLAEEMTNEEESSPGKSSLSRPLLLSGGLTCGSGQHLVDFIDKSASEEEEEETYKDSLSKRSSCVYETPLCSTICSPISSIYVTPLTSPREMADKARPRRHSKARLDGNADENRAHVCDERDVFVEFITCVFHLVFSSLDEAAKTSAFVSRNELGRSILGLGRERPAWLLCSVSDYDQRRIRFPRNDVRRCFYYYLLCFFS